MAKPDNDASALFGRGVQRQVEELSVCCQRSQLQRLSRHCIHGLRRHRSLSLPGELIMYRYHHHRANVDANLLL